MIRYLSVCSGIESPTIAWEPLGWTPIAFCETAEFPSSVLAHRFGSNLPGEPILQNGVPNLGDFTRLDLETLGDVDVLVGGTPCQSFSSTGLRQGLNDLRGDLSLKFAELAHGLARSNGLRIAVWENVPAVLSKGNGAFNRILASFIGGHDAADLLQYRGSWPDTGMAAGSGARVAWRVLDAQHYGLPQRRKRLFVIVGFGENVDPAEILLERKSMPWGVKPGTSQKARLSEESGKSSRGDDSLICFDPRKSDPLVYGNISGPLDCGFPGPAIAYADHNNPLAPWLVRRLLPVEAEAIQGLPADWTDVPGASDTARYKAIGNAMPVPMMHWLGHRIEAHEFRRGVLEEVDVDGVVGRRSEGASCVTIAVSLPSDVPEAPSTSPHRGIRT